MTLNSTLLELANHRDQILADEGIRSTDEVVAKVVKTFESGQPETLDEFRYDTLSHWATDALGLSKVGTTGVKIADGGRSPNLYLVCSSCFARRTSRATQPILFLKVFVS